MEKKFENLKVNGFLMLLIMLAMVGGMVYLAYLHQFVYFGLSIFILFIMLFGFIVIEPNEAKVMIFFGKYDGTIREQGFWWANPFYTNRNLSLRARNLDVPPIKVNDKAGNPVLIGMVLVWKIKDTYRCVFDIDVPVPGAGATINAQTQRMNAYEHFVKIQSDAALRSIAGHYAYDSHGHEGEITLRSGSEEVIDKLEIEMNKRLEIAGIEIVEARINNLAYAPEIAGVMLRRQQAEAIIAAREKIVEGAVSMVQLALNKLKDDGVIELDDDKKAAMVSNLLVVLCADEPAQPVINTGTLHT